MERILLIDQLNFIFRGKISFGGHKIHKLCFPCQNEKHSEKLPAHCLCGAPFEEFCFGDQFNLIFNFFRNLRSLVGEFNPSRVFCVGEGHPQFRYDLYADYKANRRVKIASDQSQKSSREKVIEDANEISRLLLFLPIIQARHPNFEADDTTSSLTENLKDEEVIVVSNDSDHIQILQKGFQNVRIFNSQKKEFMKAPDYPYVAWKCLHGDKKSDNIPGIVKPKKALELIENPRMFENWLSIEENRANFTINRKLIEFANVPVEEIEMTEGSKNFSALKKEFERMRFATIVEDEAWKKFCGTFEKLSV